MYIEPTSPRENGDIESFNGKLRDELLGREIFKRLESSILIEGLTEEYNQARPQCQELSFTRT